MADGIEGELNSKVGGIPVWALGGGLGLAVVIGIYLYRRSSGTNVTADTYDPSTADTTTQDPTNEDYGLPNGPVGDWLSQNPTSSAFPIGGVAAPSPITNAQWARNAIDQLLALGDDPALVTNAITKYVNGQALTTAEKAIVAIALQKFGSPPEGSIPIIDNPPVSTNPPPNRPPVSSDPSLPVIQSVHALNVTRNSVTVGWSVVGRPTSQIVYRNASPYAVVGPNTHSYTFGRLSAGTEYRFGIVPQRGVKNGRRVDVKVRTRS